MGTGIGYGQRRLVNKIIENTWGANAVEEHKFTLNDILYIIQEMQNEEGKEHFDERAVNTNSFKIYEQFVQHMLYRNLANYDSMVLLTSDKGSGKSSAAIMMARLWCKLIGIRFDPKRHLAYSNKDVMEKIDSLRPFEPLVADESVRFASTSDWNKRESKELRKKLAEVRTKHLLFILCFPLKIAKMEKTYLDSFVNYWCDLFARGLGAVYVKDKNPANDAWRLKDFKNVGSYTEFTPINQIRDRLKKHPNFWQIIKFPKPPKWLYKKYAAIREHNVYNEESNREMVTTEDIHKSLLLMALQDIMMNDTTLTMNRIILHVKNNYDIPLTKKSVQGIMSDAKQLVNKIREEQV